MGRHQYRRPPVVEAICQVQVVETDAPEIPRLARVYERLMASYPAKPLTRQTVQNAVNAQLSVEGDPEVMSRLKVGRKVLFSTKDGTRFVAVSSNEVSVHTLPPYDGWDGFRTRIGGALDACGEADPSGRAYRIAVRYSNRVSLPGYKVPLSDYFTRAPEYPEGIPVAGITSLFSRIQCEYPHEPIELVLIMAAAEPRAVDRPSFVLDIEVAWVNRDAPLAISALLPIVDDLKEKVSVAFECSLTDEARRAFDVA
jgi:uncharacterized protein (TIGR04255 family)